ncbi:MAG TPA: redoxin domain-containing protein, partial [Anaerohalosphaeraceae bacterium]|nr:redoxin domain-containing protein [Anaerohalosphaeraceae bacterium]
MHKTIKLGIAASALLILLTGASVMGDDTQPAADRVNTKPETVKDANDFTLPDLDGKPVQLGSFKGKKIVVLEWVNYDCPFVKAHYSKELPTSTALYLKYKDKDVVWLLINSTYYATAESVKEWAAGLKLA